MTTETQRRNRGSNASIEGMTEGHVTTYGDLGGYGINATRPARAPSNYTMRPGRATPLHDRR